MYWKRKKIHATHFITIVALLQWVWIWTCHTSEMSHILMCIYRQNEMCSHAHSGRSLCLSVLILPQEHGFFQKSRTRLHAFVISPAQNPFSPFIGIFLTPNFQTEDNQQVGEPPPNPEFIFPILKPQGLWIEAWPQGTVVQSALHQIETQTHTRVSAYMFMQEHIQAHVCTQRYVSTQSTHTYLCTHTDINIQTPKHTHIPPA